MKDRFGSRLHYKATKSGFEMDLIKGLDFDFSMIEVIRKLREIALILSRDFNYQHVNFYDSYWQVVISALESPEPFVRHVSLTALYNLGPNAIVGTLHSYENIRALIKIVNNVASSDENVNNRLFACVILGYCYNGFKDQNIPEMNLSIDIVADTFLQSFPPEIYQQDVNSHPELAKPNSAELKLKILALHAISWFLIDRCQKIRDNYMEYIDLVFGQLLQPNVHILIQTEVIAGLTRLSVTKYNRRRIFNVFEVQLKGLTESYLTSMDSLSAKSKYHVSPGSSAAEGMQLAFQQAFCKLWNKWYPLPKDTFILELGKYVPPLTKPFNVESMIGDHGYLSRRKKLLLGGNSDDLKKNGNIFSIADSFIKKRTINETSDFGWVLSKKAEIFNQFKIRNLSSNGLKSNVYVSFFVDNDQKGSESNYTIYINKKETKVDTIASISNSGSENIVNNPYENEDYDIDGEIDGQVSPQSSSKDSLKEDPFALNLIEPSSVTFSLPAGVLFNKFQCSRELNLYNKGDRPVSLTLQTFPSNLFVAQPSLVYIPPNGSCVINLEYATKPWERTMGRDINGFLRVRHLNGVVLERIPIKAYNVPLLNVSAQIIDFGVCQEGDQRKASFPIHNLSGTEVNCVAHIAFSDSFALGWNTALVPPKGSIQLPVIFVPSKDSGPKEVISGKLILITAYGEQHVVEIRGRCFSSLVVLDTKIDYGPCDVDIDSLTRSIVLENRDDSKKLPVSVEYSSPEFYHSKDGCSRANLELVGKYGFTLEPSERLKLPIIFRPSYAGSRSETVTISAPNAPSYVVQLLAQVSCNPSIPFSSEIHLPSVPPRGQSSIIVPVYNPYHNSTMTQSGAVNPGIQFIISMSKKSSFTLKASGLFAANPSIVSCQPTENADPSLDSFKVIFNKPGTFFMDLSFNPAKGGIYRTVIMIQTISPKKLNPPSTFIYVYGLCMSENYYKSKSLPVLRQLYGKDDEKRRTFQEYEWILGDIVEPLQTPPDIFKLNRSFISIICNSPSNLSTPAAKAKPTLTITNISAIQQKFQILMSYPFTTDFDLTGVLYPQKSVDIPVGVERDYFDLNVSNNRLTVVGFISVIDEYGKSLASCTLHTCAQHQMQIDIRPFGMKYPSVKASERIFKSVQMYNRLMNEVSWEAKIVDVTSNIPATGQNQVDFTLSPTRGKISSFNMQSLEIGFQSMRQGSFKATLEVYYTDTVGILPAPPGAKPVSQMIISAPIYCVVGKSDIQVNPMTIPFADVPVDEHATRSARAVNLFPVPGLISFLPPEPPFFISESNGLNQGASSLIKLIGDGGSLAKGNSEVVVELDFKPVKSGFYTDFLHFVTDGLTQSVMISGSSGRLLILSNLALPMELSKTPELFGFNSYPSIIDFGLVGLNTGKTKSFRLYNRSSNELVINEIMSMDPNILAWNVIDNRTNQLSTGIVDIFPSFKKHHQSLVPFQETFGSSEKQGDEATAKEIDDRFEVDWDELDFISERSKLADKMRSSHAINAPEITIGSELILNPKDEMSSNTSLTKKSGKSKSKSSLEMGGNSSKGAAAIAARTSLLPIRFAPNQFIDFILAFGSATKGDFNVKLKMDISTSDQVTSRFFNFITCGIVIPPLVCHEKLIDYGIRPVHSKHMKEVRFSNSGQFPITWSIIIEELGYRKVSSKVEAPEAKRSGGEVVSQNALKHILSNSIEFYPTEGKLLPGCTQSIELLFKPNLPQHLLQGNLILSSGDFHSEIIYLQGIGASSEVGVSTHELIYGCVRVGVIAERNFSIFNDGLLPVKYFIESADVMQLICDPESGVLEGESRITIKVRFSPKGVCNLRNHLKITLTSEEKYPLKPLLISVQAAGGYPDLIVHNKVIDFGIALLGQKNRKPLLLENRGSAEALITMTCNQKSITLENTSDNSDPSEATESMEDVIIPPGKTREIGVIYLPLIVEELNVKIFIRSCDIRGDSVAVQLRGLVGAPKIVFEPESFVDEINFDVCQVNTKCPRTLTIRNNGNIEVDYQMIFKMVSIKSQDQLDDRDAALTSENSYSTTNSSFGKKGDESTLIIGKSLQESSYAMEDASKMGECPFIASPCKGSLKAGESQNIVITFNPQEMRSYLFSMEFSYLYHKIVSTVSGIGGKPILKLSEHMRKIEFGTCRVKRTFFKDVVINNGGNLGFSYRVRPLPESGSWDDIDSPMSDYNLLYQSKSSEDESFDGKPIWMVNLAKKGLFLEVTEGQVPIHGRSSCRIWYKPTFEGSVYQEFRIFGANGQIESFQVEGNACKPVLKLLDPNDIEVLTNISTATTSSVAPSTRRSFGMGVGVGLHMANGLIFYDMGVQPVLTEMISTFKICNPGPFGIDFLIQPTGIKEMDVWPRRGYLEAGNLLPIQVSFRPKTDEKYSCKLKILWENDFVQLKLLGLGGIGKLETIFPDNVEDQKDQNLNNDLQSRESFEQMVVDEEFDTGGEAKTETRVSGIDFGLIPVFTSLDKRFALVNSGMVSTHVTIRCDSSDFNIIMNGLPMSLERITELYNTTSNATQKKGSPNNSYLQSSAGGKTTSTNSGLNEIPLILPAKQGIEFVVRFNGRNIPAVDATIYVVAERNDIAIPLRGKTGTIGLSWTGDGSFGDISTNYTYVRKIKIANSGDTTCKMSFDISVSGQQGLTGHTITLADTFSNTDPRSGTLRSRLVREKLIANPSLTKEAAGKFRASDYWTLLKRIVLKKDDGVSLHQGGASESDGNNNVYHSKGNALGLPKRANNQSSGASGSNKDNEFGSLPDSGSIDMGSQSREGSNGGMLNSSGNSVAGNNEKGPLTNLVYGLKKKNAVNLVTLQIKRRQHFYYLISSLPVSSQSSSTVKPFVKIEPHEIVIPGNSHSEVDIYLSLNLPNEDMFLATLFGRPNIPNTRDLEIGISATPKMVAILVDTTEPLNFGRLPLGHSEMLERTFKNVGHRAINWRVSHENPSLSVVPSKGHMQVGDSQVVTFVFQPNSEAIQSNPVFFEPDCSQRIRLAMYGGGGFAKLNLSKFKKFDFGLCMVGKQTLSAIPITNEGNATMNLLSFELVESRFYIKPIDWPTEKVTLVAGATFNLPVIFFPTEENPPPGKVIIGTAGEKFEVELTGFGREAVLIVSKPQMNFSDCIVGNYYEDTLTLKNVGEVNYPITLTTEEKFSDISFNPQSYVIPPFEELTVKIGFKPSHDVDFTCSMMIVSPYVKHFVPIKFHAGTVVLEILKNKVEFGTFERLSKPIQSFSIKNSGTVKTVYSVKSTSKPSVLQLQNAKGWLFPKKPVEIIVQCVPSGVGPIDEKLFVKTDSPDKNGTVQVVAQCEEAIVDMSEIANINFGICTVFDLVTRTVKLGNIGKFPLKFELVALFPLRVEPEAGLIKGGESMDITFSWIPSGAYELRSTVKLKTNVGGQEVHVRGRSLQPELFIRHSKLDYGICATNVHYKKSFVLCNRGKVTLSWKISEASNLSDCFEFSSESGVIQPGATQEVVVTFTPNDYKKYSVHVIVECRGSTSKDVTLLGVGGIFELEWFPKTIDFGDCPCDYLQSRYLKIVNRGEVSTTIMFDTRQLKTSLYELVPPPPIMIRAGGTETFRYDLKALEKGPFKGKLYMMCPESEFKIPFKGVGSRITFDAESRALLQDANLELIRSPHPLASEKTIDPMSIVCRTYGRKFQMDREITNRLTEFFTENGEEANARSGGDADEEQTSTNTSSLSSISGDVKETQSDVSSVLTKRKSIVSNVIHVLEPFPDDTDLMIERENLLKVTDLYRLDKKLRTDNANLNGIKEAFSRIKKTEAKTQKKLSQKKMTSLLVDEGDPLSLVEMNDGEPVRTLLQYEMDPVIQHVIDFPRYRIGGVSVEHVLEPEMADLDFDLSPILARPPPILQAQEELMMIMTKPPYPRKLYENLLNVKDRSNRNAKTVDAFRANSIRSKSHSKDFGPGL